MGKVKVGSKSYFKRYQVKFRRRRKNLTDYQQRRRLINQDKNKYNTPKHRLVVRTTNKDIICQIIAATTTHDEVLCCAYSHELPRYGVEVGLTNYAAAYCTGLLLARRMLKKIGLDKYYKGAEEVTGEVQWNSLEELEDVEWEDGSERRAFRCYLDVGLARTTTGARIFGALKGAVDGGLDVPLSPKRYPGSEPVEKDSDDEDADEDAGVNPEMHRNYIFGQHVADYMRRLKEGDGDELPADPEKYQKQFANYIKKNIGPDDLEQMYMDCHEKIRADPSPAPKKQRDIASLKTYRRMAKKTLAQRKADVRAKIKAAQEAAMEADD